MAQIEQPMYASASHSRPPYSMNVRYVLAKQKIDDLFLKFLSQPSSHELIETLFNNIKNGAVNETNLPHPVFTSHMITMQNPMTISKLLQSPSKPSGKQSSGAISPRSPGDKENTNNRKRLETSPTYKTNKQQSQQSLMNSMLMQSGPVNKASYDEIPQFYFGEPTANPPEASLVESVNNQIQDAFGKQQNQMEEKEFLAFCAPFLQIPSFICSLIFSKLDKQKSGKVSKTAFLQYFKSENFIGMEPQLRCFNVLKKSERDYIDREDLLPMMKVLLETHPGLEFLRATPEFQERYADTVIIRIFFMVNRRDNGRITWTEFKKSNLFDVMNLVASEDDINKVRDFFSYEHFYVLYCKFWELDQDHDFLITKEEFSKYSGHALSRKTADRIFDQIPRKFKSADPTRMSYEDFTWFVLAEEDKTTQPSIEYWFKVIDIDNNGIITGYEINYFFEEQRQRLEFLHHEIVLLEDIICQMSDLLKPEDDIKFYLRHFKAKKKQCGVFFNFLTNLNKLVSYETRDPFEIRRELQEHPDFTDWDRFAQQEYLRLAMEEENQDNGEVFNDGVDPWDQDTAADQQ